MIEIAINTTAADITPILRLLSILLLTEKATANETPKLMAQNL